MKKFNNDSKTELTHIICNCCKKSLRVENGIVMEGVFYGSQEFGYFSTRDGEVQEFELCEECYDKITAQFQIPVEIIKKTELL